MTTNETTTLIIIRHGETEWNRENRFQGHGDSPLTTTGRQQVSALAERLRAIPFDTLVSSDLGRALETAEVIAEVTGRPVRSDARLRERHYGILEGLTTDQIRRRHPKVLERAYADDPDYVIPGGESHRQVYRRHTAVVKALAADCPGTRIALVGHGGLLDSVFRFVARLQLEQPRCFVTINASLSIVTHGSFYGTRRWVIESWGDTAHLDGIGHFRGLG